MTNAARSILVFGLYLGGLGAILLIAPNILLGLFGLPPANDVWIRVAGMLVLFLAVYYVQAARAGLTPFFHWTVYVRSSVIVFFTLFVLLRWASPMLILFGVVDLLGALWTGLALRRAGG